MVLNFLINFKRIAGQVIERFSKRDERVQYHSKREYCEDISMSGVTKEYKLSALCEYPVPISLLLNTSGAM